MRRRHVPLACAAVLSSAAGCVSVDVGHEGGAQLQLALRDAAERASPPRAAPLVDALVLQAQPGNAMADTLSIAYAQRADEYAFYQLATWMERPVRLVPRLLQQRLQARGVATAVGLAGDPMRADWMLAIGIETIHHDVRTAPGFARLALTADLFDRRSRVRVAHRQFEASVQTLRQDSTSAAQAMSVALARTFDELVPWLEVALVPSAKHGAP